MAEQKTPEAPSVPPISNTNELWQTLSVRAPVVGLMLFFLWIWAEIERIRADDTAAHLQELTQIVRSCVGNSNP